MLEKIAKLLNQAENAGTEAEAATFMAKAQQLATVHSIDLARARHATIDKQRTVPVQRTIHIGEHGTRGLRTLVDLLLGIQRANDIECTISHNATRVFAVGFAEDLDVAEALFASLQVQQAKALDEFKRNGAWRDEKVWSDTSWSYKPITWLTARLNFQEAFAYRIGSRLYEAKLNEERAAERAERERASRPHLDGEDVSEHFKQWFYDAQGVNLDEDDSTAQELRHEFLALREGDDSWLSEYVAEYTDAVQAQSRVASTGLVLVEKRKAVAEAAAPALKRARGSYRGGTSGARSATAGAAGRSAADRARLGGSSAIGGTKGAISA